MQYHVTVGERTYAVEVDGGRVVVDGTALAAHCAAIPGTPLVHLLLGDDSWTLAVEPGDGPGRWMVSLAGERYGVAVVDERSHAIQRLTGRSGPAPGGGVLRAPMPGLVVRVDVVPGERVQTGVGLVVVEAMKMENELRAPREAVVQAVHVQAGQTVEKGTALVTFAEAEPSS